MHRELNVGLIGLGYWGPNYLRILKSMPEITGIYCCDLNIEKLKSFQHTYPDIICINSYEEICARDDIGAVIVAVPSVCQYKIVKKVLLEKKNVLVEKPFTGKLSYGEELVELAKKQNVILMVGYTYYFNPGVQLVNDYLKRGELGNLCYIKMDRMGIGPIRKKSSVLFDLATHDIAILQYLLGVSPLKISIVGQCYIQHRIDDYISLVLEYDKNIFAYISATWHAPEKIRRATIVCSKGMIVFDDVNKTEMVKIYNTNINQAKINSTPEYCDHQNVIFQGDITIPQFQQSEPLKNQINHFFECIRTGSTPLTDGECALSILRVLDTANRKLHQDDYDSIQ